MTNQTNDPIHRRYGYMFEDDPYTLDRICELAEAYHGIISFYIRMPMSYNDKGVNKFRTVYYLVDLHVASGWAEHVYRPQALRRNTPKKPRPDDILGREYLTWEELPAKFTDVIKGEVVLFKKAWQQWPDALRILEWRFKQRTP
jgi:hypothetical protein